VPLWQTIGHKSEQLKQKLENDPYPSSLSEALQRLVHCWSVVEDSDDEVKSSVSLLDDRKIEVVLICPQQGIHVLSEEDIKNLLTPSTISDTKGQNSNSTLQK
jgi:hypothetical protein